MGRIGHVLSCAKSLTVLIAIFALTGCAVSAPNAGDSASGTLTPQVSDTPVEIDSDTLAVPAASENE